MNYRFVTGAEYPGLHNLEDDSVWPEFIFHDSVGERYWTALFDTFPEYQFALMDGDVVVGLGNSIPLSLDPDQDGLLDDGGWDWALEKGFADKEAGRTPNVLCGLQIGIGTQLRGKGASAHLIGAMRDIAVAHGFHRLVLPIRPTLKHRYPLIPMTDYIRWTTPEGLPFDPWIRAHIRVGARIVGVCSRAMSIPGSISEWESWTGLAIRSSGKYVFDGGLVPLCADVESGRAEYVEPNVWMEHRF